jgi:branched-chain amino acid aminotransferase
VITVPWTRNERSAIAGVKTTSYAENVVALARAAESGATEALFADTRGRLSEGTGSNVFVVVGGRILTPALTAGCLAGITRALVLEWCRDASTAASEGATATGRADAVSSSVTSAATSTVTSTGTSAGTGIGTDDGDAIDITETDIEFESLTSADEIFLTSSLRDVQAVTELDGRPVGSGTVGPVTARVQRLFAERAATETDPAPAETLR